MATTPAVEMSVRELRAELADVINAAGMRDQVTFVTSRGRQVAAVVSVDVAEGAAAFASRRGCWLIHDKTDIEWCSGTIVDH